VHVLHTGVTYSIVVSPLTLVGDVLNDITSQIKPHLATPEPTTSNNLSVSLASPTVYSKPTLLIPATSGGDETYLDEGSPIGLYLFLGGSPELHFD
jgi:hypothetical protein